jgi:hypothetical protein
VSIPNPKLLTAVEVADLVSRLTGLSCSARQVRYLLVDGRLGTDTERRSNGQTRLYGVVDVALMRLARRITQEGGSPSVARIVLTYLRNDLVRAWKAGASVALAIRGVHGSLEPALKNQPAWATIWIPIRDIWHGLEREIQHVSEKRRTVWMWRVVDVQAVRRAVL